MLTEKIEELQDFLNTMIASENFEYNDILRVSQELDDLILQYLMDSM